MGFTKMQDPIEVYNYHPSTEEYHDARQQAVEYLKKYKKYNEQVVAIKKTDNRNDLIEAFVHCESIFKEIKPVRPYIHQNSIVDVRNHYVVKPRNELEYNPEYLQLVSVAVIFNKDSVLLLVTTPDSDRIRNKYTFVQGHVEFNKNAYTSTLGEFVKEAAMREMFEELAYKESITSDPKDSQYEIEQFAKNYVPEMAVYDNANVISLEHIGLITFIGLPIDLSNFVSNEPEKHHVEIFPLDKLPLPASNGIVPDDWTKKILQFMQTDKFIEDIYNPVFNPEKKPKKDYSLSVSESSI